jgi:hypothetical protein
VYQSIHVGCWVSTLRRKVLRWKPSKPSAKETAALQDLLSLVDSIVCATEDTPSRKLTQTASSCSQLGPASEGIVADTEASGLPAVTLLPADTPELKAQGAMSEAEFRDAAQQVCYGLGRAC